MRLPRAAFALVLSLCFVAFVSSSFVAGSPLASLASSLFRWERSFSTGAEPLKFTPAMVKEWLERGGEDEVDLSRPAADTFDQLRRQFIRRAATEARKILGGGDASAYVHPAEVKADSYPYWSFLPEFVGAATPGNSVSWPASSSSCFANNTASLTPTAEGWSLSVSVSTPQSWLCSDFYLLATLDGLVLHTFAGEGEFVSSWTAPTPALQWDVENKGVRVFRFTGNVIQMLLAVIDTALLFCSESTLGVDASTAARNLDFLARYAGFAMGPRPLATQEVTLPESQISSGDFFGIMRLDGMDPMLSWSMGSSTGHTTVALWIGEQLYIVESTAKGSYWPVNGVQKTPYTVWVAQAKAAGFNVVHAPLTAAAREAFNESAAIEFFLQSEGLQYGYHTLLWGWLDTVEDNYPCLPPDYTQCLTWSAVEVLFGWMDSFVPSVGDLLFNEAFNHRLGTEGLKAPELFQEAAAQGYLPGELPTVVEQDDWEYNTTRYGQVVQGRSMVCCVFVCAVWKASGVFGDLGDEVQCAELTNADDYALSILDAPPRPQACVQADPANPLCQIEGAFALTLNDFAVKAPYAGMAENCPSLAANNYSKPLNC